MRLLRLLIIATLVLSSPAARADWIQNGVPITQTGGSAAGPICAPDGAGGAFICWTENRGATSYDMYAQRIDGFGNRLWTTNGVLVSGAVGDQSNGVPIPDGAGGVLIAWQDQRNGNSDVFIQRLNSAGTAQWTANGVAVCTAADVQIYIHLISDGAGGAIVSWQDARGGGSYDIYARRINGAGTPQWGVNGNPICVFTGNQVRPGIVPDGVGGAIIGWVDSRIATQDIFAQRVNAAGTVQWAANGLPVCAAPNNQFGVEIVSDGAGGAVIVWGDERTSVDDDIYAQRINGSGAPQWPLDGIPLTAEVGVQSNLSLVTDGAGGGIAVWQDSRVGPAEVDLYGQRVNSIGTPIWQYNGLPICIVAGTQGTAALSPDGEGGVVATWSDNRIIGDEDIFAQHASADGVLRWPFDGMYVCAATGRQSDPSCSADGAGGCIVAWNDQRAVENIYAQRVEFRYGYGGRPEPTIISVTDNPSDQGGQVIVRWDASQLDLFFAPGISFYSIWRATDFVAARASAAALVVHEPDQIGRDFEGVALWEERTANGPVYWEWVANQGAVYQDTYSILAPTRQDGPSPTHYFKVIAHESPNPPTRLWESGVASGFSLDNLAPAAPLDLAGVESPWDITLTWTSGGPVPDFDHYNVYRGVGTVNPTAQYLIGTSEESNHVDNSVPGGTLFYIVTAVDIHGNQSAPSNMWSPSGTTPVGDTPSIRTLTVLDNVPNPFNGTTTFRVGLPKASDLEVDVFDVAGRRVRSERTTTLAAGWRDISFDARDKAGNALASGVYFYRVKAAGETVTRKMVIAR